MRIELSQAYTCEYETTDELIYVNVKLNVP